MTKSRLKRVSFTKTPDLIITRLKAFFNPERFQGWGKTRQYFEGWYFKVVNADESRAFALIPGVAMDADGNRQSFIQVLDGKKKTSAYHKFRFEDFVPDPKMFRVEIGKNSFSETGVVVDVPGVTGHLHFAQNVPWPKPVYSPGIMGPYAFAPFMECYHGIVSMDHSLKGHLVVGDEHINFDGGRGYIEKDWGRSFPSAYVWIQSNHFSKPGISIKASVAKIPWVTGSFVGFIAGVWLGDQLIRFTTYNSSKLLLHHVDRSNITIHLENKLYRLEIGALRDGATELASPILGAMDGRIEESMTSQINVKLVNKKSGAIELEDIGRNTGIEVAGKIDEIVTM
jgi:tocopherol cyclase